MNYVAEELTGWKLREGSQKSMKTVFNIINEQTRTEAENPINRVLKEGVVVGLANHTVLIKNDGSEIPIDDSAAPIKDKDGKITGVVLIFRDITERKKVEEALKLRTEELEKTQSKLEERSVEVEDYATRMEELAEERARKLKDVERLATIGATAGMVGHDIRNPLQAITGDLFLVKSELEDLPDNDQKQNALESLGEIEKNIDYINKIVADLQDFAKPLNPRLQETDIKSLFKEIVTKNGIPKNIKLAIDVENKAETLVADHDYLKRIFSNLTLNAVQAMPHGGKLTIRAYVDTQNNDVIIAVKDTGVGIPENVKPKLFTPMMTTKSKGQGFGLAVVKRMTEGLGGTVSFESTEGKGTTFIVRFPPQKS
jgi:PAS domain S-box-containing protein